MNENFLYGALWGIIFGILLAWGIPAHAASRIEFLGGVSVSNSISDQHALGWSIEQQTPTQFGTWNFGYLNEGHMGKYGDKRDGIYAMRKFSYPFTENIQTSFAIGPYFTSTTITQPDGIHYRDTYRWDLLAGATVRYRLTDNLGLMARWNHVIFAASKDSDIFLIGFSVRGN